MTTKAGILNAIRAKCMDCSCFQPSEIRNCLVTRCELWPYRMGRDPEPGQARGCAKPSLGRSNGSEEGAGLVSGSMTTSTSKESPLPRNHSGQGEAVQRQRLVRNDKRGLAPEVV